MKWPTTAADITPEWLTAALAARHPGADVESVEVIERHEVTNSHARLRVHRTATGRRARGTCSASCRRPTTAANRSSPRDGPP